MSRKVLESYLKDRGKSVPKPGFQGEPLPDASVGHFRSDTSHSTYDLCRRWEIAAQQYGDKKLMQARVLGYMLYYSPTDAARAAITRAILSCNDNDEQLSELAELYTIFFIHCCESIYSNIGCEIFSRLLYHLSQKVQGTNSNYSEPSQSRLL